MPHSWPDFDFHLAAAGWADLDGRLSLMVVAGAIMMVGISWQLALLSFITAPLIIGILAFFAPRDGRRWVVWTPSGYWDASPGGETLIYILSDDNFNPLQRTLLLMFRMAE